MAEASRRAAGVVDDRESQAAWMKSLPAQCTVADIALRLHSNFVVPERSAFACYPLAFLVCLHLWREDQVRTHAVLGYLCDETSPVQMSHASLDFSGAKTDFPLTITRNPRYVPNGGLLILDQMMQRGAGGYAYHLTELSASIHTAGAMRLAVAREVRGNEGS